MIFTLILAAAASSAAPNDYALGRNWPCRPGRRDVCSTPNLDVSEIATDGAFTIRKSVTAPSPKADRELNYADVRAVWEKARK